MSDRTKAYEALVVKTGLDPAVTRVVDIRSVQGWRCVTLRPDRKTPLPGGGTAFLVDDVIDGPVVHLPMGWVRAGMRFEPVVQPVLRAAPAGPQDYWERSAALAAKVSMYAGRMQVAGGRENGWMPIVERLVDAVALALGPVDVATIILQKPHGLLDVSIRTICRDADVRRFISDLALWAESLGLVTCMVSGAEGWRGPLNADEPWEYTLSDQVRALPDPLASEMLYPRLPEAASRPERST